MYIHQTHFWKSVTHEVSHGAELPNEQLIWELLCILQNLIYNLILSYYLKNYLDESTIKNLAGLTFNGDDQIHNHIKVHCVIFKMLLSVLSSVNHNHILGTGKTDSELWITEYLVLLWNLNSILNRWSTA